MLAHRICKVLKKGQKSRIWNKIACGFFGFVFLFLERERETENVNLFYVFVHSLVDSLCTLIRD